MNSGSPIVRGFEDAHGAFWGYYVDGTPLATGTGTFPLIKTLALDASRSSTIYGNSSTVTPLSLSTILIIKH